MLKLLLHTRYMKGCLSLTSVTAGSLLKEGTVATPSSARVPLGRLWALTKGLSTEEEEGGIALNYRLIRYRSIYVRRPMYLRMHVDYLCTVACVYSCIAW